MVSTTTTSQSDIRLVLERIFDAPRELVWKAWTQREHLLRWYAGEGCVPVAAELDLRPDGAWRSSMDWSGGKTLTHYGTFREVEPPRRLVFTHAWEETIPEQACQSKTETVITVTLEAVGPKRTRMTFEQVGFENVESRDSHAGGWGAAFDSLTLHLKQA